MRNITKAIVFLLCIAFALPASAELSEDVKAVLLERTEALTALMAEAADSEAYVKLYVGENSRVLETIRKIGSADWEQRGKGTAYVLGGGAIEAFVSASGVKLDDFSDSLQAKVRQAVAGSIPMAAVSPSGDAFIAAAAALRSGTVFVADEPFPEYVLVFLAYSGDYGVLCSFVRGEGGAVSASLVPVPADCESRLRQVMGFGGLLGKTESLYEEYALAE